MNIKARAEHLFERQMVHVNVGEMIDGRVRRIFTWRDEVTVLTDHAAMPPVDSGLFMPEDVARAVYEALGDYFGHSGHDTRALRRDYDAERARVDLLIANLTHTTP